MPEYKIYLKEIISMIKKIENSVSNKTIEEFIKDSELFDATLMRLHFIGETIKIIPYSFKKNHKEVRWKEFARLRNIIGHKYSSVNENIIWDVIQNIVNLKNQINKIILEE